jgi:FixJ family two-component response regulator
MGSYRNYMVHVVDDDDDVRDSTLTLLEAVGIDGCGHASARDFLRDFDAETAGCMILDIHMPAMSGFELLDLLRRRGDGLPVILFSGRADDASRELAMAGGAVALIGKPVDGDAMIDLVQRVLAEANQAA